MAVTHVEGSVYMIDAPFHGVKGVLSTYFVKGKSSIIIDPGSSASIPGTLNGINMLGVDPASIKYVAPTHIHLDHSGGSWRLLELFQNVRLFVHPRGAWHMVYPGRLEAAARRLFGGRVDSYGEIRGVPMDRVVESRSDQLLDLDGVTVKVVWTPGHASHHQSYYVPEDRVAVLGDAGGFYSLTSGVVMPTTPPPFNPVTAVSSLDKLIALEPEFVCYGHFGFADKGVDKLKAHKRQILLWSSVIEEGLNEGLSLEELYERILAVDHMAMRSEKFSTERRERSPITRLNGFVKYFEWKRKNQMDD